MDGTDGPPLRIAICFARLWGFAMLRNGEDGYGLVAIVLHWTIAILFVGQMVLGYLTQAVRDLTLQFSLYQWHKSFGFLILGLAAIRLLWALSGMRPREEESLSALERRGARIVHGALYLLLILVPLTGWAVASSSPLRIPSFAFNLVVIPHLPITVSEAAEGVWARVHAVLAYIAAALVMMHTAAALHHHFRRRDRVLMRILRPR